MYASDTLRVFGRRWLFLGFGLVFSIGVGVQTLKHVSSDYQASGQLVVLLPPDAPGTKTPINPYLNLQSGLSLMASVVATEVMSLTTERELGSKGFRAEYDVGLVPGVGPLLQITTKSKDPAMALATRDAVMDEVNDVMAELQQGRGIPSHQIISTEASDVSPTAQVLPGSRLRALVGAFGSSLVLFLVATFALDRALARRRPTAVRDPLPKRWPRGSRPRNDMEDVNAEHARLEPESSTNRRRMLVG
ncbi:hypothetical protein [Nocardioides dilutus]